jgi:O-succinylbenzoate synthase
MIPTLHELLTTARVVALPLKNQFRGITVREAMLFEGPQGWTEFSPFVEYDDVEASTWLTAAIDFGWNPQPPLIRNTVRVNATIPAVPPNTVASVLAAFPGCRTAKVKVAETGQTLADDIARVREVRQILGPEGRIRVDANGNWNIDEAEHAIHALAPFDLEYVEQPCTTLPEMAQIRQRVKHMGIPIAADESVRKTNDPLKIVQHNAADLLIVKVQPLGGITRVHKIISQTGLPIIVSSSLETSIGISMGTHLAASILNTDEYDHGLGTVSLLKTDITNNPLLPINGSIPTHRVTPSTTKLNHYKTAPHRTDWWHARLQRCHQKLTNTIAVVPTLL